MLSGPSLKPTRVLSGTLVFRSESSVLFPTLQARPPVLDDIQLNVSRETGTGLTSNKHMECSLEQLRFKLERSGNTISASQFSIILAFMHNPHKPPNKQSTGLLACLPSLFPCHSLSLIVRIPLLGETCSNPNHTRFVFRFRGLYTFFRVKILFCSSFTRIAVPSFSVLSLLLQKFLSDLHFLFSNTSLSLFPLLTLFSKQELSSNFMI